MIAERSNSREEMAARLVVESESAPREVPAAWGLAKRILFRFTCVYFFLYNFPFPLDYIPYAGFIAGLHQNLLHGVATWVGKRVFGVEITVFTNGSGDTTYDYVLVFCYLILAAAATLVWTLLDRQRTHYTRLHEWLRIYVRFALGVAMISYGADKVIPSQFPAPPLDRLLQPYGDSSPMGLLWTFIGASKSYEIFSGAAELLGGLLLIARRTTLLGALVCIGVMSNVVMLNFSYDVPVKLYSSHLLLMAVFLTLPDARRLANVFLFNRTVEAAESQPLFRRVWLNRVGLALRTLLLVGITGISLFSSFQNQFYSKSPFYGIWNVEELAVDGQVRPPLVSDESRWRRVVFDYPGMLGIQLMSDSRQRFFLRTDPLQRTFELTQRDDPDAKSTFAYRQAGPGILTLEGTLAGRKIRARIRRVDNPRFPLVDRGFHWINEYPFNR